MSKRLYLSIIMIVIALIAIIIIQKDLSGLVGANQTSTQTRGGGASQAPGDAWNTTCLRINTVKVKLYNADTPSKWFEGYMYKNNTDFLNMGAVGMIFKIPLSPGSTITFTMRNVAFPLYLLHISPIEGVGDAVIEIIYMEPEKNYTVTLKTSNDYFIELDPGFLPHIPLNSTVDRYYGIVSSC
ncbi:MAG: hypothetical protein QXI22_08210 [Sulfolobales archaeon]